MGAYAFHFTVTSTNNDGPFHCGLIYDHKNLKCRSRSRYRLQVPTYQRVKKGL